MYCTDKNAAGAVDQENCHLILSHVHPPPPCEIMYELFRHLQLAYFQYELSRPIFKIEHWLIGICTHFLKQIPRYIDQSIRYNWICSINIIIDLFLIDEWLRAVFLIRAI